MSEKEWLLDELMQEFIAFKRSMGYACGREAYHLVKFLTGNQAQSLAGLIIIFLKT